MIEALPHRIRCKKPSDTDRTVCGFSSCFVKIGVEDGHSAVLIEGLWRKTATGHETFARRKILAVGTAPYPLRFPSARPYIP